MNQPAGPKEGAKRKAEPKTQVANRAKRFAEAQDKRGLVRWQPWVTREERELLAAYLLQLRHRQ